MQAHLRALGRWSDCKLQGGECPISEMEPLLADDWIEASVQTMAAVGGIGD